MAYPDLSPRHADSDNDLLRKIAKSLSVQLGQHGVDVFTTGTHIGTWGVLHATSASVVTIVRDGTAVALTLIAGDSVRGVITSVTVTSGTVELHRV